LLGHVQIPVALTLALSSAGRCASAGTVRRAWLLALLFGPLFAQQPITFQYFYDDLNQLVRVVDSTGISIEYDLVGPILDVNNTAVFKRQADLRSAKGVEHVAKVPAARKRARISFDRFVRFLR
jgi:hypothetical protein